MSSSAVKKKQVRFARMEDDDDDNDNDELEEDTLFDKRRDTGRGPKSALRAAKRTPKTGCDSRVDVLGGGGGGGFGRWMVTVSLCAAFLGLGMSISVLGPTFEDLANNVKKDISNISYIFVGRSGGYIGGSLIGGLLTDVMNPHLLLGLSLMVTAFGMCAVPFCENSVLLTVLMSSIGMSMGVLDTGGNVVVLNTWGEQSGPHMQALHFSFAAGAFFSPIIAKLLFASDFNATNITSSVMKPHAPQTGDSHTLVRYIHSRTGSLKSMWAYIVIGSFLFLTAFIFFILYMRISGSRDKSRASSGKPLVVKYHALLVVLQFFFYFAYVGAEVAYGSFIFTYAKDYAHMKEHQAAGLNSFFWAVFAAFRGLAIFCATCMYPGTMIVLSLIGSVVSSLVLCLFSWHTVALWLGTGLYGASMATTFPSGISWVEQYATVTGRMAAIFVVGAALGEMVLPAVLTVLHGKVHNHPVLMYMSLGTAIFTAVLFPLMYKLTTPPGEQGRKPRSRGRADPDAEDRQALLDSAANEEEEEADRWNDADFEVIEMDDAASVINSPKKPRSPPDVKAPPGSPAVTSHRQTDSPQRTLLLPVNREKRD
ncbi:sodium-dependent glucose transporter 1 [Thalassophryne amazonica]|uniref:sodium-dependent glucose transporter 1 n=1 Tax=Thalassophryne amazonica TaxID=390379 RepID=UPI001471776B|nr:sodium-dependent glucose transporter 1 [Thalassophryne amazonica]